MPKRTGSSMNATTSTAWSVSCPRCHRRRRAGLMTSASVVAPSGRSWRPNRCSRPLCPRRACPGLLLPQSPTRESTVRASRCSRAPSNDVAVATRSSSERPLHDAPEERHHDQDHELGKVDSAQHGEQFRAHRGCLGSGPVLLVHTCHQFLIAQGWLKAAADSLALSQRPDQCRDVVHASPRAYLEESLLNARSQAVPTKRESNFLPQDTVRLGIRGEHVEGPLQRHPGHDESADHAHQLRQLALDRALAPATALRDVACRRNIAAPDKEWDKGQGAGCPHPEKTCDQTPHKAPIQADDAELDAIDPIGIHAGLDQADWIEVRRTKVKAATPNNGYGTQPALVPSLPPLLMLPPLHWGKRRCADQFD